MIERGRPHLHPWADGSRFWRAANLALLVAEGRDEEALAAYEEYARLHAWTVLPAATHPRSNAARALERLGRHDEAIALCEEELALARTWGAPGTVGPVLRVLGLAARRDRPARGGRRGARRVARAARAGQGAGRPRRRDAPRPAAERRPRAAAARARAGRRVRGRRPGRARPLGALRHGRPPAHDGHRRGRGADRQRASRGGLRRRGAEQPRHRAGAVRDAQDRRGPPQQRLPQARHPLAARAGRRARAIERLGERV